MPVKEKQQQETPVNPAVPAVVANVGDKTQINQMRQSLVTEIKELRKQVLLVQLQSMKVMQQSIHSVFKAQAEKTSEQIAQQGTDLQQQLEEETEALKSVPGIPKTTDTSGTGAGQVQAFNNIVLNAMQAAQQSVDSAMQAAQNIMVEAEHVLKSAG